MCGIAGISVNREVAGQSVPALRSMMQALRHRGPDDQGFETFNLENGGSVGIANTRLSILDTSAAGHQPMTDPASGCCIVLNGEIYNHLEVRAELGARAGVWRSTGDTETVLKAYALWGADCLQRMRGMFALAIWDPREQVLWCARDRLGIKPFYYFSNGSQYLFASEVRALLSSGVVPKKLDEQGLKGYVRYGSLPEPLTLIEGVQSLEPGYWVKIRSGSIVSAKCFWKPTSFTKNLAATESVQEIREELTRSVREHLLSDVPVSVFLSGGIDSSAIAALASQARNEPLQTFTIGFEEDRYDESLYAAAVAKRYNTDHHLVRLSRSAVSSDFADAVGSLDLPSIDGANTYFVSRAVAQAGFKVVLSGLGGDELFGGYRSFSWLPRFERWSAVLGRIPNSARSLVGRGSERGKRIIEMTASGASLSDRYASLRSLWPRETLAAAGLDGVTPLGSDTRACPSLATRISLLEMSGYMRSVLLRDCDSMSMAHSLELRVPFLDHKLVELCLTRHTAECGVLGKPKRVLLEAVGHLFPEEITRRRKQGFVLPMEEWMRGPLRAYCEDGLRGLEVQGVSKRLAGMCLEQRTKEFYAGQLPWARIWQFVVLGHWLRANLN